MSFLVDLSRSLYANGLLPSLAYVGCFLIAIFVLAKNPKNRINQLFFVLTIIGGLWNVITILITNAPNAASAEFLWRAYYAMVALLVAALLQFSMNFSGNFAGLAISYFLPAAIIPPIFLTNLFVNGATTGAYAFSASKGPYFIVLDLYILLYILLSLYVLVRAHNQLEGINKERAWWVSLGLGMNIIIGVVDIALDVSGFALLPFSSVGTLISVTAIAYSFQLGGGVRTK